MKSKKIISALVAAVLTLGAIPAIAASEPEGTVVTTALEAGGEIKTETVDGREFYALDKTFGVYLGKVTNKFSVSALVQVTSDGNNDTVFFKNMGDKDMQKWTGVQSKTGKAAFWSHGSDGRNKTVVYESKEANLTELRHLVYTENAGVGTLYIDGILQGRGNVANGVGDLYLGATYWEDDAPSGFVGDIKIYDYALSYEEVFNMYYGEYSENPPMVEELASEVVDDMELVSELGIKTVAWETSDESVISADGTVTRGDADKTVTLKALIDGEVTNEFNVTVLKKAETVNDDVIFSYVFNENDGSVIHDASGNGNHATAYNGLKVDGDGAHFDGLDDYVKLPAGILNGHDDITIVFKATPEKQEQHIFAYAFGNTSSTGYIFLNTSRPNDELRFAETKEGSSLEKAIYSAPGVNIGEEALITVTISGTEASLYKNGELLMTDDMGMTVSELGDTEANYIAKSLYDGDGYFKGTVKEFTVYNRALTADEVKALK